jgi:hypothetical protein
MYKYIYKQMSNFDVLSWINMIEKIYNSTVSYKEIIEEELYSDLELKETLDKNNKAIEKFISTKKDKNIDRDSIKSLLENLYVLDEITMKLMENIKIITNQQYIKTIQRSMSDTYYNGILNKNKSIIKESNKLVENINKYVNGIATGITSTDIKEYKFEELFKIYVKGITDNTTKVFLKLLQIYKSHGVDIRSTVENIKDVSLGYGGEKFSKNPYCSHPLLLMGLTFNLSTQQPHTFVDKELLLSNTDSSIVLIDNSLELATNIVIYNLKKLLYGDYADISRNSSINLKTIEACRSIIMEPVTIKKNTGIKQINMSKDSKAIIYESLDGMRYRKMDPPMVRDLAINIDIGPKPRVYLYNKVASDILINKKDVFLRKIPEVSVEYIDVSKFKNLKTISDVLKAMGIEKDKSRDKYLYYIVIANKLLVEIRKLIHRKDVKDWRIPVESYLVKGLF